MLWGSSDGELPTMGEAVMSERQLPSIEEIRAAWDAVGGSHESVGIDDEVSRQYNTVGEAIDELEQLRAEREDLRVKVNAITTGFNDGTIRSDRVLMRLISALTTYFGGLGV
jgi:hypothetical protein